MSEIDARLYSRAKSEMPVEPPATVVKPPLSSEQQTVGVGAINAGQATQIGLQKQQSFSMVAPTRAESAQASIMGSLVPAIWESLTIPKFEPDTAESPQAKDFLKHIPFQLSEAEYSALFAAPNAGTRQWYVDQFTKDREISQVAGEYPLQNFAVQLALDPRMYVPALAAQKATKVMQAGIASEAVNAARAVGPIAAATETNAAATAVNAALGPTRLVAGAASMAADTALTLAAEPAHPLSNGEVAAQMLASFAGGLMIPKGARLVPADPDLNSGAMIESLSKPHMRMVSKAEYTVDDFGNQVKVKDAVWEEIPRPMREGASATTQETAAAITSTVEKQVDTWGKSFGNTIAWNTHKTMASLSKVGQKIADIFVDNNMNYGVHSVESLKAGVLKDFQAHQASYEELFRAELANRGFGTFKQFMANRLTREADAALNHEIAVELMQREQALRTGRRASAASKEIQALADKHGEVMDALLKEQQRAKVLGADAVKHNPGYFHRSYSAARMEKVLSTIEDSGVSHKAARAQINRLFQASIKSANPQMTDEVAGDIAQAIVDRTIRKGRMEDVPENALFGKGTAAEVRDMLQGSGLSQDRVNRVVDALLGKIDEQGKASYLKHRIDLDYNTEMVVGGNKVRISDLIETNLNTIMDRQLNSVAAKVALTEKGLGTSSAIGKLRDEYILHAADRTAAKQLFDDVLAHIEGRPTGEAMNEVLRNANAYSRMITLGASAIWQFTEYATMAAHYGYMKTFKYAMAEMPLFRNLMETAATDKVLSRELKDIITNQADLNIRLRPYIQRFEDNFDMPMNSRISHMGQQGAQMVPYANGMKIIHAHQARMHANLLVDVVRKAATGDAKALEHLRGYGIESHILDKLRATVTQHGMAVDEWDDGVWEAVRPSFAKMTDESVLHARMGDMPAFAMFNQTGKFIFQYRSFVLTAHNKVLAGTAGRDGLGAVALLAAYQFPLAMMATQANEVMSGRKPLETDKLITKSIGQMGALGIGTEIWNWLSGSKREFGAPGLIPFDRGIRAGASTSNWITGDGSGAKAAQDASSLIPLFGVVPGWKMLNALQVNEEKGK